MYPEESERMSSREISLRVADARQRDVGQGKARVENETMQKLGITAEILLKFMEKG